MKGGPISFNRVVLLRDKYDVEPFLAEGKGEEEEGGEMQNTPRSPGYNGTCVIRHTFPMNMHLRG